MFDQSLLPEGKTHKKSSFALALAVQGLVIALAVLIPMLYVEALPMPQLATLVAPPPLPPPPPPPPAAPHPAAHAAPVVHKLFNPSILRQPVLVPTETPKIEDVPAAPQVGSADRGVPGGVAGGQIGGVLGGVLGGIPTPAPPPPPKPTEPKTVRVGGNVQAAKVVSAPKPSYPFAAKQARVQGTVRLQAIIGEDGHIKDLKAVSGSPLLVGAAVEAVKKWVYQPTYLNGHPVNVATEIDVEFRLAS